MRFSVYVHVDTCAHVNVQLALLTLRLYTCAGLVCVCVCECPCVGMYGNDCGLYERLFGIRDSRAPQKLIYMFGSNKSVSVCVRVCDCVNVRIILLLKLTVIALLS